jgi:hypothetical protein
MALKRPLCDRCAGVTLFPGECWYERVRIAFYACHKCSGYWHRIARNGGRKCCRGREFPYFQEKQFWGRPDYDAVLKQIRAGETDVDPKPKEVLS